MDWIHVTGLGICYKMFKRNVSVLISIENNVDRLKESVICFLMGLIGENIYIVPIDISHEHL